MVTTSLSMYGQHWLRSCASALRACVLGVGAGVAFRPLAADRVTIDIEGAGVGCGGMCPSVVVLLACVLGVGARVAFWLCADDRVDVSVNDDDVFWRFAAGSVSRGGMWLTLTILLVTCRGKKDTKYG